MKKTFVVCATLALLGIAVEARAEIIKLKLDGVVCDQCSGDLIDAIEKVPTVKLKDKPSKAKPMATVDIDLKKSDIGELGKAISDAETPHKAQEAPGPYLILEAPGLTDASAKKLGDALKTVKGVVAPLSSADAKKKEILVKIDGSGNAKMADIQKALAMYLKK